MAVATDMRIERLNLTYARNGVGGQSGYWATFEAADDGGELRRFAGWIWHECRSECEDCEVPNECSVILLGELVGLSNGGDPNEVHKWRSTDYFLPALLPHVLELEERWLRGEIRL